MFLLLLRVTLFCLLTHGLDEVRGTYMKSCYLHITVLTFFSHLLYIYCIYDDKFMPLNALQADCKSAKLKSVSSLFILCVVIFFRLSLKILRKCCIAVTSCFADMNSAMGNGPTFSLLPGIMSA